MVSNAPPLHSTSYKPHHQNVHGLIKAVVSESQSQQTMNESKQDRNKATNFRLKRFANARRIAMNYLRHNDMPTVVTEFKRVSNGSYLLNYTLFPQNQGPCSDDYRVETGKFQFTPTLKPGNATGLFPPVVGAVGDISSVASKYKKNQNTVTSAFEIMKQIYKLFTKPGIKPSNYEAELRAIVTDEMGNGSEIIEFAVESKTLTDLSTSASRDYIFTHQRMKIAVKVKTNGRFEKGTIYIDTLTIRQKQSNTPTAWHAADTLKLCNEWQEDILRQSVKMEIGCWPTLLLVTTNEDFVPTDKNTVAIVAGSRDPRDKPIVVAWDDNPQGIIIDAKSQIDDNIDKACRAMKSIDLDKLDGLEHRTYLQPQCEKLVCTPGTAVIPSQHDGSDKINTLVIVMNMGVDVPKLYEPHSGSQSLVLRPVDDNSGMHQADDNSGLIQTLANEINALDTKTTDSLAATNNMLHQILSMLSTKQIEPTRGTAPASNKRQRDRDSSEIEYDNLVNDMHTSNVNPEDTKMQKLAQGQYDTYRRRRFIQYCQLMDAHYNTVPLDEIAKLSKKDEAGYFDDVKKDYEGFKTYCTAYGRHVANGTVSWTRPGIGTEALTQIETFETSGNHKYLLTRTDPPQPMFDYENIPKGFQSKLERLSPLASPFQPAALSELEMAHIMRLAALPSLFDYE